MAYSYIKKIYQLVKTLFGNMKNYNCNNYTYYKYYETPKISSLISFIEKNKNLNLDNDLENENVTSDNYLNSINHHIIITPYIKLMLWKITVPDIVNMINNINIENLWYNHEDNFEFKNFNINTFLKLWDFNTKNVKKYNLLNNEIYLIEYEN